MVLACGDVVAAGTWGLWVVGDVCAKFEAQLSGFSSSCTMLAKLLVSSTCRTELQGLQGHARAVSTCEAGVARGYECEGAVCVVGGSLAWG